MGHARCENSDSECNYDVCLACFKGDLPEGLVLGVTCGNMHKLEYRQTCKYRPGSNGSTIACDLCKESIQVWNGYYTCNNDCDYDICSSCFKG